MRWFWNIKLSGNKKLEKLYPEEKVILQIDRENNQHKSNFFKGTCNTCDKYGHRASDFWRGEKRETKNKNIIKPRFNGEGNNCGEKSQEDDI